MKRWVVILGRGIGKAEGILAKEGECSGEKMEISRMGEGKRVGEKREGQRRREREKRERKKENGEREGNGSVQRRKWGR